MPKLDNMRQEAFAQYLYEGMAQGEAYEKAGYKLNKASASKLANSSKLQARLQELMERGQRVSDVTKDRLTQMLMEEREAATAAGQHSAAVSALEKVGKLHGLFIEKTQNENLNMHLGISDEPEMGEDEWSEAYKPH